MRSAIAIEAQHEEPPCPFAAANWSALFALLVLVLVWALLAMALAQSVLTDINGFVAAIYYVVAGLGWVLPAMPLISWMADRTTESRPR